MPRSPRLVALGVLLLLAQVASAAEAPGWNDFDPGSWRVLRYSSRFGERPPQFEQVFRQTLTGFDSYGRPKLEIERVSGDEGDPGVQLYRDGRTPDAWGLELRGEPATTTLEVLGRTISAWVKTYEGSDPSADRIRVTVVESDQVRLFPRILSQWQTDEGFLLGPGVVRAVSERVDSQGTILTVEQDLVETGTPIEVGNRIVTCAVTRSRSYYQPRGTEKGDPRQEITRWLSPEVPGHVAREVADLGAETRTLELLDFGTTETSGTIGPAPEPMEATPQAVEVPAEPDRADAQPVRVASQPVQGSMESVPTQVDDLQDALKRRWEGAWAVASVELHSDCDGTFTSNEVEGRLVGGSGLARFPVGEIVRVEDIDVHRSRIDVRLSLVEPLLVERQEGAFALYEERRCQVELKVQVDRETVKEDLLADAEEVLNTALERQYKFEEARSSALWNKRKRRDLPPDYEETLAQYRTWRRGQQNREVRAWIQGAIDRASSYLDHLVRDPQAASAFAAGAASVRGRLPADCSQLMALDDTRLPSRTVGGVRADEAYAAGQRLAFYLELAQRLDGCLVDESTSP